MQLPCGDMKNRGTVYNICTASYCCSSKLGHVLGEVVCIPVTLTGSQSVKSQYIITFRFPILTPWMSIRNLESFTEEEYSPVFEKSWQSDEFPVPGKEKTTPIIIKDIERDLGNYWLVSLTSMPHNIMEQTFLEARQSTWKTEMWLETANMGSTRQIISE